MILHRRVLAALITSAMLFDAGAASAGAGIVQCVDAAGSVTFTDAACRTAADAARASGAAETVSDNVKTPPSARNLRKAEKAYGIKREGVSEQRRSALDASTVRTAKVSLVAMDEVSALIRQQAQERRSARAKSGWTFW